MTAIEILAKLIPFDTTSRNSNMELMHYVQGLLAEHGIASDLIPNADGTKANLLATIGPADVGGVMLSGHTDVVPVDGQDWTRPAFEMTEADGKIYGRGTTDMKGFVACAIAAAIQAQSLNLKTPLHLALSYDEEVGCQGVRSLIDVLERSTTRPAMCIVGEPTSMAVATGHKGKIAVKAKCIGEEGHSALAPLAFNALHLGCDLVNILRDVQADLATNGAKDSDYDVAYTTVHVGKMSGGVALNIVPNLCEVDFEIRNLAEDSIDDILGLIKSKAATVVTDAKTKSQSADIIFETTFSYPGLNTPGTAKVVEFVKSLIGANSTCKVAFGTEGGLFSDRLNVPTVVCGPGSMAQGHKPDEFITIAQLNQCNEMLAALLGRLQAGL